MKGSFQTRVNDWAVKCFGAEISKDKTERNHRFLEESLELVQSIGCTKSEAHQLVDYVFDREVGEIKQECGGVMTTLAVLCAANGIDMNVCGEVELQRIWSNIDKIRQKQAAKPKHSPLPQIVENKHTIPNSSDDIPLPPSPPAIRCLKEGEDPNKTTAY